MITRQPLISDENPSKSIIDYEFNQDYSCLVLCTSQGFQIYNINPLKHIMKQNMKNVVKVRMLHRTNYVAFLTSDKNVLHVWDDIKKQDIVRIKLAENIKQLFLSREYMLVGQSDHKISIYKFGAPWAKLTDDIRYGGVCEFANGLLVYSNEFNLSQIHITRLQQTDKNLALKTNLIKAHENAIRIVRISKKADMIATCSIDGTTIRVFQTETGTMLKEFRRGLDRAKILDMSWCPTGNKLAIISDKWTLHVFDIFNDSENRRHMFKNWINFKYFQSEWSSCNYKLKVSDSDTKCKICWTDDSSLAIVWPRRQIIENYNIIQNGDDEWILEFYKSHKINL